MSDAVMGAHANDEPLKPLVCVAIEVDVSVAAAP